MMISVICVGALVAAVLATVFVVGLGVSLLTGLWIYFGVTLGACGLATIALLLRDDEDLYQDDDPRELARSDLLRKDAQPDCI